MGRVRYVLTKGTRVRLARGIMRVAFDVTIAARSMSGVGVYGRELLPRLQGRALDVVQWQRPLGPAGTGRAGLANALRLSLWFHVHVPRRIRAEHVTIYHAATSVAPLSVPCPLVMTVYDAILLMMRSQYGLAHRIYHRVFSVLAARRAAAIIVPSAAACTEVARVYRIAPDRLCVVPLGVSPRFRPVPASVREHVLARLGIRAPYVLFVGAEPPRKNLARLIEAFAQLRRSRPERRLELILAGPPQPEDPAVRGLVTRLGLTGDIRRIGWVSDEDLPALYSGAICLAYPSLAEGFGLPILEAMACGTSVLTSDGSSMAEIAGDAALLVDPLSTDAIAGGLRQLVDGGALIDELVARGRERVRAFTWERTAEATEQVYRRVAAGRRA
jgi:glycosyltransferase involved in cell wall biosynthesis